MNIHILILFVYWEGCPDAQYQYRIVFRGWISFNSPSSQWTVRVLMFYACVGEDVAFQILEIVVDPVSAYLSSLLSWELERYQIIRSVSSTFVCRMTNPIILSHISVPIVWALRPQGRSSTAGPTKFFFGVSKHIFFCSSNLQWPWAHHFAFCYSVDRPRRKCKFE